MAGRTATVALIAVTAACGQAPSVRTGTAQGHGAATTAASTQRPQHKELVKPNWESFLLLGLDQRGSETPRSDTMIIVNWDKANNVVNVLSVPRDLWVNIPNYGWYKLGSAYSLGAGSGGTGGPQLVEKTLESNLGITIDYYAAVSLESFRTIVDKLGGVWVDVPYPLVDNEYPTDNYQYQRVLVQSGLQHMDGATALEYARSRHEDSDFGRSARQQQLLMSLRSQVVTRSSATKIPALVGELHKDVKTDLSTMDMIALAPAAMKVDSGAIHNTTLDYKQLIPSQANDGESILAPRDYNWARFRQDVAQLLTEEG